MKQGTLFLAGICIILIISITSCTTTESVLDKSAVSLINPEAECLKKENHFYIPFDSIGSFICIPNYKIVSKEKEEKKVELNPTFTQKTYDLYVNNELEESIAKLAWNKKLSLRLAVTVKF